MKILNHVIVAMLMVFFVAGCKDRAAEKRIAELESRLLQLEGGGGSAATSAGATPVVPAAEQKPEGPLPVLSFDNVDHDFGTISEGEKVSYTYTFKNSGEAPLIIQNAQPSCGCTVPEWSKEPIPVGGTGYVKAEFDSNGKPNIQNKTITVTANTWPKVSTLRFKAMVTPKGTAGANGPTR